MRRQNRIKIHRCKCDCVSRRIYIRTLGTDELLSDWGRWPITLEICLLTFGKVSTSKFKAAIGQIWDVGMMICPLAHYFIIIFFLLHLPACTQNSSFWWERQRDESTAEQPSTDFCLTFTIQPHSIGGMLNNRAMITIDMKYKDVNDWIRLCWFNLAPLTLKTLKIYNHFQQQWANIWKQSAAHHSMQTVLFFITLNEAWMGGGRTWISDNTELHRFAFPWDDNEGKVCTDS